MLPAGQRQLMAEAGAQGGGQSRELMSKEALSTWKALSHSKCSPCSSLSNHAGHGLSLTRRNKGNAGHAYDLALCADEVQNHWKATCWLWPRDWSVLHPMPLA